MIQEFLAKKLEEEMKTKTLFDIAQASKIKTTSLTRLHRYRKASIKTCEKLFEYFGTNVFLFYQAYSTTMTVKMKLKDDATLSDKGAEILENLFAQSYSILRGEKI